MVGRLLQATVDLWKRAIERDCNRFSTVLI
jgi:hypothetical protein